MTSTMLATLIVMAVWENVMAGGGEASCTVDQVPTMKNFDVTQLQGIWYDVQQSHIPPTYQGVRIVYSTCQPEAGQHVYCVITLVKAAGVCTVYPNDLVVDPSDSAQWTELKDGKPILKVYHLATDYVSTRVLYVKVMVNGVVSKDHSVINVSVRDPTQRPNAALVSEALVRFCGEKASSPDFLDDVPADTSITCDPSPIVG